jgi:hypothetical protein
MGRIARDFGGFAFTAVVTGAAGCSGGSAHLNPGVTIDATSTQDFAPTDVSVEGARGCGNTTQFTMTIGEAATAPNPRTLVIFYFGNTRPDLNHPVALTNEHLMPGALQADSQPTWNVQYSKRTPASSAPFPADFLKASITVLAYPSGDTGSVSVHFDFTFNDGTTLSGTGTGDKPATPKTDPQSCNVQAQPDEPILYLYPPKKQDVVVKLDYPGDFAVTYPDYDRALGGWRVTAHPDGHLIDKSDKREYSYLFWEAKTPVSIAEDMSTGFSVAGADTKAFFQKVLPAMGLLPREYNEFIVYWLPRLMTNKFNFIHFAGRAYQDVARLSMTPPADSTLRVFMLYRSMDAPIDVKAQEFVAFTRKGFTAVEWGGSEIKPPAHPGLGRR